MKTSTKFLKCNTCGRKLTDRTAYKSASSRSGLGTRCISCIAKADKLRRSKRLKHLPFYLQP